MIQKRAIKRAKTVIDAAITLLVSQGADDISLADVAVTSGVPLPSIYNFFPNKNALFIEVARQFHAEFNRHVANSSVPEGDSWQNLYISKLMAGVDFQNANPAMMRLFLGSGVSSGVKNMDLAGSQNIAHSVTHEIATRFNCIHNDDLENKVAISFSVADGVWGLSYSEYSCITEKYRVEGIRAAVSYLRLYLPEYLEVRQD